MSDSRFTDDELERIFKKGLESGHFEYDPQSWHHMESLLDNNTRKKKFVNLSLALGLICLAFLLQLNLAVNNDFSNFTSPTQEKKESLVNDNKVPVTNQNNIPESQSIQTEESYHQSLQEDASSPAVSAASTKSIANNNANTPSAPNVKTANEYKDKAPHKSSYSNTEVYKASNTNKSESISTPNITEGVKASSFSTVDKGVNNPIIADANTMQTNTISTKPNAVNNAKTPPATSATHQGEISTNTPKETSAILQESVSNNTMKQVFTLAILPTLHLPSELISSKQKSIDPITLPLVTTAIENSQDESKKPVRLILSLYSGPKWSATPSTSFKYGNAYYGLGIGVPHHKKWITGLQLGYTNDFYVAGKEDYKPWQGYWTRGVLPDHTDATCKILNLGINTTFMPRGYQKNGLLFGLGWHSTFMLEEHYFYQYTHVYQDLKKYWGGKNVSQDYLSTFVFTAGYTLHVNKRIALSATTNFDKPIYGIGHGRVLLSSSSFLFGAHVKL
jgi:hypothetical protein